PHAVGEKKPNGFGLYDMHGNVFEWNEEMLKDAAGTLVRVSRGGAWNTTSGWAVSTLYRSGPANRGHNFGLRVARSPLGVAKVAVNPPPVPAEGFTPLFNGKDLSGWKPDPANNEGVWRVEKDILTGSG